MQAKISLADKQAIAASIAITTFSYSTYLCKEVLVIGIGVAVTCNML